MPFSAPRQSLYGPLPRFAGRSKKLPDGRIAQLVEQLTLNQRVLGSSPSASTTSSKFINNLKVIRKTGMAASRSLGSSLGSRRGNRSKYTASHTDRFGGCVVESRRIETGSSSRTSLACRPFKFLGPSSRYKQLSRACRLGKPECGQEPQSHPAMPASRATMHELSRLRR